MDPKDITSEPLDDWQPPDPLRSAMNRVQVREAEAADARGGFSWTWIAGPLLLVLSVAAVWFWTHRDDAPGTDLLRSAVESATEFRPVEITDDPDRAASYVLETFGLPLFPPELDDFVLLGVGSADLAPGVSVPAYRYDGRQSVTVVVYVYDYILLDEAAAEGLLQLAPEVYARLAEPEPVDIRREGNAYVVTWRRRATIFSAVTPGQESAERVLQSVRRAEL